MYIIYIYVYIYITHNLQKLYNNEPRPAPLHHKQQPALPRRQAQL